MKQYWSEGELVECWTLTGVERQLSDQRTQRGRLGLAVLLKFFQFEGRFPDYHKEVPLPAVDYVAEQLDVRYKINSAHITVMRFCNANADWKHLLELIEANRMTDFGETSVTRCELIFGDWYASANTVRTLQQFKLKA